jgi:hypothetical protein
VIRLMTSKRREIGVFANFIRGVVETQDTKDWVFSPLIAQANHRRDAATL